MSKPTTARAKQKRGAVPATDLGPADSVAYEIVGNRADLRPSVERIVNAGLSAEATEHALTLFRTALTTAGDPHRDPRAAIASATGGSK
jgi:hypothetical protein